MSMWHFVRVWASVIGIVNVLIGVPVLIIMADAHYVPLIIALNDVRIRDVVYRYGMRRDVIFEVVSV